MPRKKSQVMKKFLASLIFLAAMVAMPAAAQVKFGVKGGLNSSNMKFNYDNLTNKSGYGWYAGVTLKATAPLGLFGLGGDISAFYDWRRSKAEVDGLQTTIKQQSIVIPLNARVNFTIVKSFGLYIATGPQLGINVGDGGADLGSMSSIKEHFQLKKTQFSWNIGAGLILSKHFELGAAYNLGIGKTGELKDLTSDEIKNRPKQKSWVVSLAYYF